jgi:hypothetical protein
MTATRWAIFYGILTSISGVGAECLISVVF